MDGAMYEAEPALGSEGGRPIFPSAEKATMFHAVARSTRGCRGDSILWALGARGPWGFAGTCLFGDLLLLEIPLSLWRRSGG